VVRDRLRLLQRAKATYDEKIRILGWFQNILTTGNSVKIPLSVSA
jgi:hypothetical protein